MTFDEHDADLEKIKRASEQIHPVLSGQGAIVQGAILADLLAMWLAGHICLDDRETTEAYREQLLAEHIKAVRRLIPVNEAMILARHQGGDGGQ